MKARLRSVFTQECEKLGDDGLGKLIDAGIDKAKTHGIEIEEGISKFIEWVRSGKLQVRVYPSENLHAKLYVITFVEGHIDKGRVITGSSNLSESGLQQNLEFNVELKNRSDRALVTVQRDDGEGYPSEVLLASALRVLTRDAAPLKGAPAYRANLWGIAGVNAARLGDVTSARRYLLRAALTNPRRARAWVRAVAALVPGVARRRWAASTDE
jgi:phosphatidylserine/phosphatidylglycerophosphate/cardiolipin synthase-like enzyme